MLLSSGAKQEAGLHLYYHHFHSSGVKTHTNFRSSCSYVLSGNWRQNGGRREGRSGVCSPEPCCGWRKWVEPFHCPRMTDASKRFERAHTHTTHRQASMTTSRVQEFSGSPEGQSRNNTTQIHVTIVCIYSDRLICRKWTRAPLNICVHAYCNLHSKRDGECVSIILQASTSSIMY